ncbi:MAG: NAD(P)H-hydrate dehydratase [Actinobacteria bacterium]|nr:MAG: NAD(P)H-hydrate dehydratase [Actinomycetota bacterium]
MGHRRRGRAVARPDGAGGRGTRGAGGSGSRARPDPRRRREGQQRRRRPSLRAPASGGGARGGRARGGGPRGVARRRARKPRAAAGRAAGAVRPRPSPGVGGDRRRHAGDGLRGEGSPREPIAGAIGAINAQDAPVVACDVPSGVNASTGEIEGDAVRAEATATFHGSKIGLHVAPGAFHSGRVEVVEIGIPRGAPSGRSAGLISRRVVDLVPHRARDGSKFSSGTLVIAGGAAGYTGAPCMVGLGAQRTGAGYIQLAVPKAAQKAVSLRLLEAVTRGLPEEGGAHVPDGVAEVQQMAERAGCVVLGPGLGRSEGAQEFARELARTVEKPMLIDADGLNAHAGRLETLRERPGATVLTPHAGELARLLEVDSEEVSAHRLRSARDAAERSGCVVLLKGDDTIVAAPGGPAAISPGATPALATAGTGDVLSGVIGALLSKGMDVLAAAAAGVLVHAEAGRIAAERLGADHTVAGDAIEALPAAMERLRSGEG